ncbi:MAG: methyltransferase domain-containing protein [Pseudomonadota bacterium]|nr:methyltransferase domain-containing protein [Pseudomonadota bacterium]
MRPLELDFLARAGLRPHHHLLDVGCGPGFFAAWAAQDLLPLGKVTGVDADPALLEIASAHAATVGARVTFRAGTAARIPLPDASVDFAYARFLFQHLDAPAEALAEMRRVTRPGGTIALVDTDDGGLVVYPAPSGLPALLRASRQAQAARGGDREVGRKLKALLHDAGLESPAARVYTFSSEDVGGAAFVAVTLGFKAQVLGPPWIEPAEVAAVVRELRVLHESPGFFGQALGYGAWARVPDAG